MWDSAYREDACREEHLTRESKEKSRIWTFNKLDRKIREFVTCTWLFVKCLNIHFALEHLHIHFLTNLVHQASKLSVIGKEVYDCGIRLGVPCPGQISCVRRQCSDPVLIKMNASYRV